MSSNIGQLWIGIDWGTTNLRAWLIDSDGQVVARHQANEGMSSLQPKDYPDSLKSIQDALFFKADLKKPDEIDVLICGMAGSRQGWREAPYGNVPCPIDQIYAASEQFASPENNANVTILGGLSIADARDADVMRGEETQIVGLCQLVPGFAGLAILPGTHSKWVWVQNNEVEHFLTAMSGELFHIVGAHSVLKHAMPNADHEGASFDVDAFDAAVSDIVASGKSRLVSSLFTVRANALLNGATPAQSAGTLSGMIIGSEIVENIAQNQTGEIALIGAGKLSELYQRALQSFGINSRIFDVEEVTLRGLIAAKNNLRGEETA